MQRLAGKVAVITGGARGLGAAYARALAAEGAACVITVPVDGNAGSVTYTGGTPVITEVGDPATAAPAAATPQPTASADPLSDEVLLQAVAAVGSEGTVWGTAAEAGLADATAQDSPHRLRPLEGKNIDLWIAAPDTPAASGDYIFYGHWAEVDQKVTDERTNRGVVWGGSMPYGKNPDGSFRNVDSDTNADTNAETIQYATGAADALIYHSTNGKTWTATTANAALTANFKTGYINGTIDTTGLSTGRANGTNLTADANGDITLKDAMIKSAGTFSGTAEFSAAGVSNQSGSWNGGFFGDPVTGGLTQAHQRPSNVAGEFRVSRPAIGSGATARQSQLHVRGAFGGADEGS